MKVGRNDPCPCGSGKKFKKCCLDKGAAVEGSARAVGSRDESGQTAASPARSFESQRCRRLIERLSKWFYSPDNQETLDESAARLRKTLPEDEQEMNACAEIISAWMLFGRREARGRSPAELYLAKFDRTLADADRDALTLLVRQPFRLVETQDVRLDEGLTLKDWHSGEVFDVCERSATRQLRKWDLLLTRLRPFEDHLELDAAMLVDRRTRHVVLDAIDGLVVRSRRRNQAATAADALQEYFPEVVAAVLEGYRLATMPPELRNADGDQVLFCKARFRVADEGAVRQALGRHRSLALDADGGFTWLSGPRRKGPFGPGRTALGGIFIDAGVLTLDTQSRERLERGKALLQKVAGDWLTHMADLIADPRQVLANRKNLPARAEPPAPPEIEREVVGRFVEEHYRKWPDTQLPALHGMTPREASKSPHMRRAVADLVKDLEHGPPGPNMPACDFGRIRRELGLDDDS